MAGKFLSTLTIISAGFLMVAACAGDREAVVDEQLEAAEVSKQKTAAPRVEGQLMMRFKDSVSSERASEIFAQENVEVLTRYSDAQMFHIGLPEGLTVEQGIRQFSAYEEVDFVEPNQVYTTQDSRE